MGTDQIKSEMQELDAIVTELKTTFTKIDYTNVAQSYFKDSQNSKEAVLEKIYGNSYKLI